MARKKTTFYVDEEILRATRVLAARSNKRDSDIVEEALRRYTGFAVLDRIWARNDMDPDEAMKLAYEELHAMRAERDAASG